MAGMSDGSMHFVLAEDPRIHGKVPGMQQ